jgi:hypothetical protein
MLEETLLLYTLCRMNVCAESHLSECRNRQTDGSNRPSIAKSSNWDEPIVGTMEYSLPE